MLSCSLADYRWVIFKPSNQPDEHRVRNFFAADGNFAGVGVGVSIFVSQIDVREDFFRLVSDMEYLLLCSLRRVVVLERDVDVYL